MGHVAIRAGRVKRARVRKGAENRFRDRPKIPLIPRDENSFQFLATLVLQMVILKTKLSLWLRYFQVQRRASNLSIQIILLNK